MDDEEDEVEEAEEMEVDVDKVDTGETNGEDEVTCEGGGDNH